MKYIIKKTGTLIITLFIVSLLAFLAFQIIPGDPTTELLGTEATEESRQALRQELGLDRPVLVRYWDWLSGFVKGDMGESYNYRMPVSDMLADKLPVTALLTLLSFIFTIALSIPLGIWAGSTKSRIMDLSVTVLDQIIMSVPPFFIGMLACYVLGNVFKLFVPGNFVSYTSRPGDCYTKNCNDCEDVAILNTQPAGARLCAHLPQPWQQSGKDTPATCSEKCHDTGNQFPGGFRCGNNDRKHNH